MCLGLGGETSLFVQIRSQLLCSLHGFQIELCRAVQWHWQVHRRQSGSLAVRSTVEARNDWYLWAWRFVQRPVIPWGRCSFLAELTYNRHHRSFHGQNLVWRSVETENSKSVNKESIKLPPFMKDMDQYMKALDIIARTNLIPSKPAEWLLSLNQIRWWQSNYLCAISPIYGFPA